MDGEGAVSMAQLERGRLLSTESMALSLGAMDSVGDLESMEMLSAGNGGGGVAEVVT